MIPPEIFARPGDKILPKFKKLVAWIDAQQAASTDPRVTAEVSANGTLINVFNPAPTISTPLQVRNSGTGLFSVGEGYINGRLPQIQTARGKLEDIVDPDGIPAPPAKLPDTRPLLVVAKVTFKADFSLDKIAIETAEPKELSRSGSADYSVKDKTITGKIPLAFIRSNNFIQFVSHSLQVRAYLHSGLYRVVYWPA